MPRVVRDSDEESETKTSARKTRASSAAATSSNTTDSPARRSTRSAKQLATIESSPEIIEEINTQPTTRKTRSRAATLDKTMASRSLRSRKRSVSSDRSQSVEMESETTQKRVTRKAATTAPSTPTKPNLRVRNVRAGSEVKSTPPPAQAKRVTRASSVDPVGKNEESASTPVKRRTRASMAPAVPTLAEELDTKKRAVRSLNNTVTEIDENNETTSAHLKSDVKKKTSKSAKEKLDVIKVEELFNDSQKPLLDSSRKNEDIGNNIPHECNEIDDEASVSSFSLVYVDSTMGFSVITEGSKFSKDDYSANNINEVLSKESDVVGKTNNLVLSAYQTEMRSNECSKVLNYDEIEQNSGSQINSSNSIDVAQNHDNMHDLISESQLKRVSQTPGLEPDLTKVGEKIINAESTVVDSTNLEVVQSSIDSNSFNALMNGKTAIVVLKDVIKEAHEILVGECKKSKIVESLEDSCKESNHPDNDNTFNSANVSDDSGNVSPTIVVADDDDDDDDECDINFKNIEIVEEIGPMNSTIPIDAHNQVTDKLTLLTNKEVIENSILINNVEVDSQEKTPVIKNDRTKIEVKQILSADVNEKGFTVAKIDQDQIPDGNPTAIVNNSTLDRLSEQSIKNGVDHTNDPLNITAEISTPEPTYVDLSMSQKDKNNHPNESNVTDIDTNQNNPPETGLDKDALFSAVPDTGGEDASSSNSKRQSNQGKERNSMTKKSADNDVKNTDQKAKVVAENTDSEDNLDGLFQDIPAEEWAAKKPNDSANSQNEVDIESTVSIHKDDDFLDESYFEHSGKGKSARLSIEKRDMDESLEQTASVCDDRSDEADESPEKTSKSPEKQRRLSKELKPRASPQTQNLASSDPQSVSNEKPHDTKSSKKSTKKLTLEEESESHPADSTSDARKYQKLVRGQNVEDSCDESMEIDSKYDHESGGKKKGNVSLNASYKSADKRRSSLSYATSDFSLKLAPTESPSSSIRRSVVDKSSNNTCNDEKQFESIQCTENGEEQTNAILKNSRKSIDRMNKSSQSPIVSHVSENPVMKMSTSLNDSKSSKRNSLTKGAIQNSLEDEEDTNNKENEKSLNKSGNVDNSDKRRSSLHNESKSNAPSKNESLNLSSRKSINKSIDLSHIVDEDSSDSDSDAEDENQKLNVSSKNKSLNKSRKSMELQNSYVDGTEEITREEDNDGGKLNSSLGTKKDKKIPKDQIESSKSVRRSIEAMKSTNPRKHDYSTIAEVGSSSDEYEVPNFIFRASSSDEDENENSENTDDDESRSIDSDTAKELNLAGKEITKYSDDDVPADDCRASEEEQSDSEDEGSDLESFVVPDDEVDDSDSTAEGDNGFPYSSSESDEVIAAIKAAGAKVKAMNDSKTSKDEHISKSAGNKSLDRSKSLANGSQNSSSESDEEESFDAAEKSFSKDKSLNQSKDRKKSTTNPWKVIQKKIESHNSSSKSAKNEIIDSLSQDNAKNKSLNNSKLLKDKSFEKPESEVKENLHGAMPSVTGKVDSNSESDSEESEIESEKNEKINLSRTKLPNNRSTIVEQLIQDKSINLPKSPKGKSPNVSASFKNKASQLSLVKNSQKSSSDDSDEEDAQSKDMSVSKSVKNTSTDRLKAMKGSSAKSPRSTKDQSAFITELHDADDSSSEESDDDDNTAPGAGSKNLILKVEPPSSESEAENGEDSYKVIVTKPDVKSHPTHAKGKKLIECSTPKPGITKKRDFSKTSDSLIEKSSAVITDKRNTSGRKSEGTIDLSDTKIMSKSILGSSRTNDNSVKFNEVAEVVTPEADVLDNRKPWKLVPLNQTAYPSSAETPDTRFLKKAKLNESYPILESMRSNEFDDLLSSTKKEGKKNKSLPTQSSEEAQDDQNMLSSSKKSKKRKIKDLSMVQSAEEDMDTSTVKKSKKRPRVEDSSVQDTGDSSNNKDTEEVVKNKKKKKRREGKQIEVEENIENEIIEEVESIKKSKKNKLERQKIEEVVEVTQLPDDVPKKKNKKKKNKNAVITAEALEEPAEESAIEESEPKKKKKKKKEKVQPDGEAQETAYADEVKSKKKPELPAQVVPEKKSKKSKKQPEPSLDSDDEAPESLGFEEARRKALESMQQLAQGLNAQKQARKKKLAEHSERVLREKLAAEERRSSLKRLPENFLDQLGDAPAEAKRPVKRQKLSSTTEKKQLRLLPSSSMFSPNTMVPATLSVKDAFRPLLSQSGSTTRFGVVDLSKTKRLVKKSERAVQFRDKFLSRNARQPMSAYNAYLLKQKAKGSL